MVIFVPVNHGDNVLTGEVIHLSSFIHRHCCQHPRVCVDGLREVLHWASALPNPLTIRLTNITVTLVILCSGRLQGCQGDKYILDDNTSTDMKTGSIYTRVTVMRVTSLFKVILMTEKIMSAIVIM